MKHRKWVYSITHTPEGELILLVSCLYDLMYIIYMQKLYYSATDFCHSQWITSSLISIYINLPQFYWSTVPLFSGFFMDI